MAGAEYGRLSAAGGRAAETADKMAGAVYARADLPSQKLPVARSRTLSQCACPRWRLRRSLHGDGDYADQRKSEKSPRIMTRRRGGRVPTDKPDQTLSRRFLSERRFGRRASARR